MNLPFKSKLFSNGSGIKILHVTLRLEKRGTRLWHYRRTVGNNWRFRQNICVSSHSNELIVTNVTR